VSRAQARGDTALVVSNLIVHAIVISISTFFYITNVPVLCIIIQIVTDWHRGQRWGLFPEAAKGSRVIFPRPREINLTIDRWRQSVTICFVIRLVEMRSTFLRWMTSQLPCWTCEVISAVRLRIDDYLLEEQLSRISSPSDLIRQRVYRLSSYLILKTVVSVVYYWKARMHLWVKWAVFFTRLQFLLGNSFKQSSSRKSLSFQQVFD